MPYALTEIEVTQPLPEMKLSDRETGIGVIVRRHDRPIGFLMQAYPPNTVLTAIDLEQWIARDLGAKLLQETIRAELQRFSDGCATLVDSGSPLNPPILRDFDSGSPQTWGGGGAKMAVTPSDLPRSPLNLTVAICTKDRPENLARCLQSLIPRQTAAAAPFEILVVDNAPSDDRTRDLIATLPSVRYVQEPKPGLDFARNRALQSATGEFLAFLDDDVTVDRGWYEGLVTAWTENPDAGGFTGLVLPYELATDAQILFESRGGFRRGFEKIRYGQVLPGNPLYPCGAGIFGAGCNMAFRRDLLLKLGGFDDALDTGAPLPGGGDLDIFYRVVRSGHPVVYEPSYLVYHQHRRELETLQRQYWTWGLGFMAFVVKSYQTDPAQRDKFQRLIGWWFKNQLKEIKHCFSGKHPLPIAMLLAELWGGIVGLLGEYPRSCKRIEQIRRQYS